ncbi:hypothetical protein D3C81_1081920 [compost metagenome]
MDTPDQFSHLVEDLVYLRHHVDAVYAQLVAYRAAQGGVQGRAAFRGVEDLAGKQRLDCLLQANFIGQTDQQITGLAVDQVLRIVEKQPASAQGKMFETLRISIECLAHAEVLHGIAVLLERVPRRQGRNIMRGAVVRHRCRFPYCVNCLGH